MSSTDSTRRPTWHEIPRPAYRSQDAIRHGASLLGALQSWFESAMRGELRHLPLVNGVSKTEDDLLPDCATVLSVAVEWEGYLMAVEFSARGWPADYDLVQRCNRWSCDRKRARIALYHKQQEEKRQLAGGRS